MMNVYNKQFITSQIMNANFSSTAQELYQMYGFSITATVTGTPTGVIHLECSNDPFSTTPGYAPTTWVTIDDSDFTLSAAGSTVWNFTGAMFNYVRVVYVDGSSGASTAVLSARINAKG